jgi:hypothetical protein
MKSQVANTIPEYTQLNATPIIMYETMFTIRQPITIGAKPRPRSVWNISAEIRDTSFPELVSLSDFTDSYSTFLKSEATSVLRMLIQVIIPY